MRVPRPSPSRARRIRTHAPSRRCAHKTRARPCWWRATRCPPMRWRLWSTDLRNASATHRSAMRYRASTSWEPNVGSAKAVKAVTGCRVLCGRRFLRRRSGGWRESWCPRPGMRVACGARPARRGLSARSAGVTCSAALTDATPTCRDCGALEPHWHCPDCQGYRLSPPASASNGLATQVASMAPGSPLTVSSSGTGVVADGDVVGGHRGRHPRSTAGRHRGLRAPCDCGSPSQCGRRAGSRVRDRAPVDERRSLGGTRVPRAAP